MGSFQKEDQTKNVVEFVVYSVTVILFIVIGFGVIGAEGIFRETEKLLFYMLLTFYNIVFIVYSGLAIFIKGVAQNLIVYLHNFENSFIQNNGLFKLQKGSLAYTILDNFVLTFLVSLLVLSPIFFLGFIVPRQTAVQILPVAPQSVLPVQQVTARIFYNVFPAFSGETGLLAILNSLVASLIMLLTVKIFGKKSAPVGMWIVLFVVGFLVSGFAWNFVHGTVSAGREFNQVAHFVFGVEQGILMILTGSIAPALAIHFLNLLFWVLNEEIGGIEFFRAGFPLLMVIVFGSIIAITVIFATRKKKRKRR